MVLGTSKGIQSKEGESAGTHMLRCGLYAHSICAGGAMRALDSNRLVAGVR